ncbi:hypothetical protein [Allorhizobium taibaishanense]|uniref:Uncharacterized protein n=1 Tax=Allorhizobium taibaishanense TaxID=887144 RepID=A0A7W6HLP5_9HYPH|nr:hypothetical protein [Allorhizobium taibaishanense]MBB4007288.1 hypothetical protein [Allorhizobium taibaishanense]
MYSQFILQNPVWMMCALPAGRLSFLSPLRKMYSRFERKILGDKASWLKDSGQTSASEQTLQHGPQVSHDNRRSLLSAPRILFGICLVLLAFSLWTYVSTGALEITMFKFAILAIALQSAYFIAIVALVERASLTRHTVSGRSGNGSLSGQARVPYAGPRLVGGTDGVPA